MFSLAVIKAIQVYGISIVISILVAVLIKIMVSVMGKLERPVRKDKPAQENISNNDNGIPDDVVAALSAAIAVVIGPHKILHIEGSQTGWAETGRAAHHASHSRQFKTAL